jgi:hypothetical protein
MSKFMVQVNEEGEVVKVLPGTAPILGSIKAFQQDHRLLVFNAIDELDAFIQAEKLKEQQDAE